MGFKAGDTEFGFDPAIRCQENHPISLHGGKDTLKFNILGVQTPVHQLIAGRMDGFREIPGTQAMHLPGIHNRSKFARLGYAFNFQKFPDTG